MKKSFDFSVLFISLLTACCTSAYASEFSADMTSRSQGQTMQAKIFVKDQKCRVEMPQATMINRSDLNVAWMLMPDQKMYMEHPVDPKLVTQTTKNVEGETAREALGKEMFDGKPVDKFKVTYSEDSTMKTLFQWIDADNNPVKVEAVDGSWGVEFHNIQTSALDDSLFEAPSDYQKIELPSMPSGLPSGMPDAEGN